MATRKFNYSLESLIKKGKLEYDQQFLVVDEAGKAVKDMNRRLELAYEKQLEIESDLRKQAESGEELLDPGSITLRKNFLVEHKELVESIRLKTREVESELKNEKSKLLELSIALKALEKHKDRSKTEFYADLEKIEMREIDELWLIGKSGR